MTLGFRNSPAGLGEEASSPSPAEQGPGAGAAGCCGLLHVISNSRLYSFMKDLQITDGQLVTRSTDWSQRGKAWPALKSGLSPAEMAMIISMSIELPKCRHPLSWSLWCEMFPVWSDHGRTPGHVERGQETAFSCVFCQCNGVLTWLPKPWQGNSVPLCFCLAFSLSCFLHHCTSCSQRPNYLFMWFLNDNSQLHHIEILISQCPKSLGEVCSLLQAGIWPQNYNLYQTCKSI